jgi:hypothetical protein
MDEQPWLDWHCPTSDRWVWGEIHQLLAKEATTFKLTAGEHTLYFGTREDGAQLDAIYITTDAGFSPLTTQTGDAVFCEAEKAARIVSPMVIRREEGAGAGRCEVRFAWPQAPTLSTDLFLGHPRLHARVKATQALLITALAPLLPGEPSPTLARTERADGAEVTVKLGKVEDRFVLGRAEKGGAVTWTLARSLDGRAKWGEKP